MDGVTGQFDPSEWIRNASLNGEVSGYQSRAVELDKLLAEPDEEYDWAVPNLLEHQDRVIITGPEGHGKSTLLRQWAVQFSCGIHPFDDDVSFDPLRVLYIDLENSKRQFKRKMRELRTLAGSRYHDSLQWVGRPEGINFNEGEGEVIQVECDTFQPDALFIGPIYKMMAGDPNDESTAIIVASHLDKIRTKHNCLIVMESHSSKASHGNKRPREPYGASMWMRWPEFGLYINDTGEFSHWRGDREERPWPSAMNRLGKWPWEAGPEVIEDTAMDRMEMSTTERLVKEAFFRVALRKSGRPTVREVEAETKANGKQGFSVGTIGPIIKDLKR